MSEMENKLNAESLENVSGGISRGETEIRVRKIQRTKVRVTAADGLHCRYTPDGPIAKTYPCGHILTVDGITADGKWYRLLIYDPRGGTCYGYIYKKYTEVV